MTKKNMSAIVAVWPSFRAIQFTPTSGNILRRTIALRNYIIKVSNVPKRFTDSENEGDVRIAYCKSPSLIMKADAVGSDKSFSNNLPMIAMSQKKGRRVAPSFFLSFTV